MNDTLQTMMNHRTIRAFKSVAIDAELMAQIIDATLHTATSRGIQNASIIRIQNQATKDALAQVSGQPYTATAPEYLLFIVDLARPLSILTEKGLPAETIAAAPTMDTFREAFTDACLLAQSAVVAGESLGLGTALLGSILNDPSRTIEILSLPKYTFPVLGLLLGYPNQEPQLKPRIPASLRVMTDSYQAPDSWIEALAEYDAEMNNYYDLRTSHQREDSFTNQILTKIGQPDSRRAGILGDIKAQGFVF